VCVLDTIERLDVFKQSFSDTETVEFQFPIVSQISSQFDGADAIVHLACTTHPATSMESMVFDAESNIISSLKLFDSAVEAGVSRIVFASSGGTVYGSAKHLPAVEHDPTTPICAYGVSKLTIENYLSLYSQSKGVSLRIGNPYGPYQLRGTAVGVIANFLNAAYAGKDVNVWGDGSVIRDYLYVSDVAEAFVQAITSENIAPGSYNVGSGIGHSIVDLVDTIATVTGRELTVDYRANRSFDVPKIVLDNRKLHDATGWKVSTTLEAGITLMWQQLLGNR